MTELGARVAELESAVEAISPQMRMMQETINALAVRVKPGWWHGAMRHPGTWVFLFGILGTAASYAWAEVEEYKTYKRNVNGTMSVMPLVGANFERLAAGQDNICVAVAQGFYQLSGRRGAAMHCGRTEMLPLVPKTW